MLLKSNLRLLLAQLERLAETSYFSPRLDAYIDELRGVASELISRLGATPPSINDALGRFLAEEIWKLTQFLTGSTTKQIPYEVVYAVERAAAAWTNKQLLVTTAIVQESNFFFQGGSEDFFEAVKDELGIDLVSRPVQIALPYIYRHKPLFCTPLFHELGHFVDTQNEVVATSMLSSPETVGPDLPDLPTAAQIKSLLPEEQKFIRRVVTAHRREYFADLFGVAYAGRAAQGFLEEFCPDDDYTPTHPSSSARFALMDDFLAGRQNPIIDLYQVALKARGLPQLQLNFAGVALDDCYGDVRPFTPKSDADVFGLFDASWTFLVDQWSSPTEVWSKLGEDDRVRAVNDLTEKSIRNRMVQEAWGEAAYPR